MTVERTAERTDEGLGERPRDPGGTADAMHSIRLTLRDPAGKRRPLRLANVLTRNGQCRGVIQIAFNDAPGTWRLTAVDALTGLADSSLLTLLPAGLQEERLK